MSQQEKLFDVAELSTDEQTLLQKALKGQLSDLFQVEAIPKREIHSPVPLSYPQQRLWVLSRMAPGNPFYNTNWVFQVKGKIEVEVLGACINEMIRRHEALRTIFTIDQESNEPVQVILPELKIKVNVIDVRSLPVEEQQEECTRLAGEETNRAFDLEEAPLIRVNLMQQSNDKHFLLINVHHIIFDGGAIGPLMEELTTLYDAFARKNPSPLPELPVQYADFSLWQRECVQGVLEKQLSFWKELLSGELPFMELPADRPHPAVPSFKGGFLSSSLPNVVGAQIIELSQQQKCSMFMTLLAALNVLFYRYSGQEDILMGFPIANRTRVELESLIGFFANTLVFRTDLSGNPTFRELQNRVKKMTSDAYDNQDVPFEKLIEEFQPDRYLSHTPFFQVMAHYGIGTETVRDAGELDITHQYFHHQSALFDLWITLTPEGFGIQYNGDIFDESTIKRMLGHFNILLASIGADPDQRINDILISSEEEKTQLLVLWNNTRSEYNWQCLHHTFEAQVEKTPDRIALIAPLSAPISVTYRELNEKSDRLASLLIEKGVGTNTIVGIMMERSIEMITGLLGILKAGGAYLPIDPGYPPDRIKYMLDDCNAPFLLTMSHHIGVRAYTRLQGLRIMESSSRLLAGNLPPIEADFDGLPIPDRSLVNYEKYTQHIGQAIVKHRISLQTTRGCPYKCAYCHKIRSKKHVFRLAENIFEEIRLYYRIGIRRFVIIDDIFNLNKINSSRFFQLIIKNRLKVQLFFPSGLRGDLLTKEYIDLMVEAGAICLALALETASPRLQKLIGKNLNLEKLKENINYFCEKHPQVILELFFMHGFPTETREEALKTLEFLKDIKWVHFPYFQILKIFPNTDMTKLAIENGIPIEAIERSTNLAYHELPETLPFDKSFTLECQADFFNNYFLAKDRLKHVLPFQRAILTEDEMVQKYNSYLPLDINNFKDLLRFIDLSEKELGPGKFLHKNSIVVPGLNEKIKHHFPAKNPGKNALKVLLLDLSQFFSDTGKMIYTVVEPPIGLMYIMTYLNQQLGSQVNGKIAQSRIDFDSFEELSTLLEEFKPDVIGIRALAFYRDFFHKTAAFIKQKLSDVPIIAGGPYASSDWTTILQDRNIDLAIRGEGEISFTRLVSKIIENNGKLPGEEILAKIPGAVFIPKQGTNKKTFPQAREILMLDSISPVRIAHKTSATGAKDPAYIIYTSGSTGKPKGVVIDHQGISNRLLWMQEAFNLNSNDRILQKTPFNFDVSVWEFFWPLLNGATLVMAKPEGHKDCSYLLEVIKKEKITFIHFVPSMLNAFLEEPGIETARSLRRVISSGEALPTGYVENFYRCFHPNTGTQLVNLYGPTEASVDVTYWSCTAGDKRGSVPIGQAIANTQIYILDPNLYPVPIGVPGELCIAGIQLARGYLNRPELTHEKFLIVNNKLKIKNEKSPDSRTKLYKTGDLARWLSDGNIEFLGRQDFQVKIKGVRIELGEIESKLRSHPFLEDAVIITRKDKHGTGDQKLCAYIIPGGNSWVQFQEQCLKDSVGGQVADWQEVFNNTYTSDLSRQDPYFNTVGWNSSYTGAPLPAEEMRQLVDYTVERILSLKPGKVLEIGCGNGLLLFPIIPYCQFYRGTDISEKGLNYIRQQLTAMQSTPKKELAKVELRNQPADHLQDIETKAFDLVILNSVVQYFPGVQYLLKVLTGALNSVKPGGYIFVGDVRSLPLLKTFHVSVEFHKAEQDAPNTTGEQLNQKVMNRLIRENELALDPSFFTALKGHFPRIKHVELHLKRSQYRNELTRFRYDVILRVDGDSEKNPVSPSSILDWHNQNLTLSGVRKILLEKEPEYLAISRVPNSRIAKDLMVQEWLESRNPKETVEQFLQSSLENRETGVDPEDFWCLQAEFPYQVDITLSDLNSPGVYNVVFRHRGLAVKKAKNAGEAVNESAMRRPFHTYANNPLQTKINAELVLALKGFLNEKLPEYMVPSYYVLLEKLPVTSVGKLDRKALLLHESLTTEIASEPGKRMVKPRTDTEKMLIDIWKDVILIDEIGINDNFFQLGGDSINAIQVISRLNKRGYKLSVRHLFQNMTIAQLANFIDKHPEESTLTRETPGDHMDMELKTTREELTGYLPPGAEIADIYPLNPLQQHMLSHYLNDPGNCNEPGLYVNQVVRMLQFDPSEISIIEKAFQELTNAYPFMRTALIWEHGGPPVQVVYKQAKVEFQYHDLSHLSPDDREEQVQKISTDDRHRSFDQNSPDVNRLTFIRLEEDEHQLLHTTDMMRADGWSGMIVMDTFMEYLHALFTGQPLEPVPDNSYKEYFSWLSRQEKSQGEDYFRRMVQGCTIPTPLVVRAPQNTPGKRKIKGFTSQSIHFSLQETVRIDNFLMEKQIILSSLGCGVWAFLLSHYSNQKSIVFGMLLSGRGSALPGIESMVGAVMNVLPMRVDADETKPVLDWLKDIHDTLAELNSYDFFQQDKIREIWNIPGNIPLFESYIVLENFPGIKAGKLEAKKSGKSQQTKGFRLFPQMEYPLRVELFPLSDLRISMYYYRRCFTDEAIEVILKDFRTLLLGIMKNPYQPVAELRQMLDDY